MYQVFHLFDVDGGIGDAISHKDLVATFESEEMANAFVNAFSNEHIYASPYDDLKCGRLVVESVKVYTESEFKDIISNFKPWWKRNNSRDFSDFKRYHDHTVSEMFSRMEQEEKERAEKKKLDDRIAQVYKCDSGNRIAYWDNDN